MPLEKGSSQATNSKNSATAGATFCLMPSGHGEDDRPATRKKGRGQSRHHDHGGTGTGRAGGYLIFGDRPWNVSGVRSAYEART
jgi:hypothetical protein